MYLFFYIDLGLNDFEVGYIHYSGHWKGWAQKSLDFQGPPLPVALEMDAAHIKIISSRPI
jgi:hypothetical protein